MTEPADRPADPEPADRFPKRWISESYYHPTPGTQVPNQNPLCIISRHQNWPLIREEICAERPDYPVRLMAITGAAYGEQYRGIEFWNEPYLERQIDWYLNLLLHLEPGARRP